MPERRGAPAWARWTAIGVVAAVVVGVVVYVLVGPPTRKYTAYFSSAVGLYSNSGVRILGVPVGRIDSVTPQPHDVKVVFEVQSKYKIPAQASAVIVAPALVSDRYIQLTPAYSTGPALAAGSTIPQARTAAPMEIDQITAAVNQLMVALGPKGANAPDAKGQGSVSELINSAAANFKGNGANLGASITNLAQAAKTLAAGSPDLYSSVKNLTTFVTALQDSDSQVRSVNELLSEVVGNLADQRQELGSAITNLTGALSSVAKFITDNRSSIQTSIASLTTGTNILLKQKASLNELLAVAPTTVSNLVNVYDPKTGALRTRLNLGTINPNNAAICSWITQTGPAYRIDITKDLNAVDQAYCRSHRTPVAGSDAASVQPASSSGDALPVLPGADNDSGAGDTTLPGAHR